VDLLEPARQRTPLHYACESHEANVDMVELLLRSGANIEAVEEYGHTPLRLAAASCDSAKIKLLISRGCAVRPTANGYTPFIDAMSHGANLELISILLSAGEGRTPAVSTQ
jgi:hypothetical protein